jgi:23S rRNA (guanosine2251-2'-O)-methyltransferase
MGRDVIVGRQPVCELLRAGRRTVHRVLIAGRAHGSDDALAQALRLAQQKGVAVQPVSAQHLERLARGGHHQGIAAEAGDYPYVTGWRDCLTVAQRRGEPALLLMLDHIQDPQNLGAILRTCDAAGVHGVIIPKDRACDVTPAVVRASAGASEYLAVARVANLHDTLRRLRQEDVWAVGLEGVASAKLYTEADLAGPLCLVVGSEGEGLSRIVRESCDYLIRVPMRGGVGSLNASVAAGIALYEILRQRGRQR